ncbi:MAG: hypothetical protein WEC35_05540 [Nitrosopumilaceae archaeon]
MEELENIKKILKDHEKRILEIESIGKKPIGKINKQLGKRKTISDLLMELKQSSFFNQPRFVSDIVEKLAENGYHYSGESLTYALLEAVRTKSLGRIKKEKKWAYVKR